MRLVELGIVGKPHGFRGEFVALTDSGQGSALETASKLFIGTSHSDVKPYQVLSASWMPKGWKLKLEGVESEDLVRALRGQSLFIQREELPPTEDNEFYLGDLVGCAVYDEATGTELGKFESVEHLPLAGSHDRWHITLTSGDTLSIPAVKRYIAKVDVTERAIWLRNLADFK